MKRRSYTRITYTERLIIEKLYNSKTSYSAIARRLGRSVSTIHYEVKRGLYTHFDSKHAKDIIRYSADVAQDDADWQSTSHGPSPHLGNNYEYANAIATRIKRGESPDSIVGSFRRRGAWTVSTKTLYRYIDRGYIPGITNKNLIVKGRPDRKRYSHPRPRKAPQGQSIEQRPPHIDTRTTPGHWEMDCVIGKAKGKNQAVLVLTERMTRYELVYKLPAKTARSVVSILAQAVTEFPYGTFQTITVDNGSEFANYELLKTMTKEVYYCHPYTSCERGSNENANRLIRRFLPKGKSMVNVTQKQCDQIAKTINGMHRKILGYRTAAELFNEWQSTLT